LLKRFGLILLFAVFAGAAPAAAQPSPASPSAADSLSAPAADSPFAPAAVDTAPTPAVADTVSPVPFEPIAIQRVGRIRVTGNTNTDSARIVRSFEVLPGSRYTQDAVRRGIRKLVGLGLFDDVSVDLADSGDPAVVDR
jgi:outer membrane protein assembly factor BamA